MTEIFERFCDAEFSADWDTHARPLRRRGVLLVDAPLGCATPVRRDVCDLRTRRRRRTRTPRLRCRSSTCDRRPHPRRRYLARNRRRDGAGRSAAAALRNGRRGSRSHPSDVVAAMIWGQVRRVVVDSAGVVINMGRRQRLFTRQRPPSHPVAIESLCGGRVCDTDPTLRSRPPHRMGPPRTHQRPQRRTRVWPPQPVEELRLPRPPRRPRLLAHLPTRRHRNQLTVRSCPGRSASAAS